MRKLRKMLGKADSDYILELMSLIETQNKITICNWCIDYAEKYILPIYMKYYPTDDRPQNTINLAREWLEGKKKLPEVKKAILNDCHQAARENEDNPAAQAAARAIGQAASTIHAVTHSLGIAFYGASAIAYETAGLDKDDVIYDEIARIEVNKMIDALKKVAVENEPNPVKVKWYC